jgi:hypothetical protein
MTIHLNTVMEGLSPEQRQRVDDRVAELIAEDPNLQDIYLRERECDRIIQPQKPDRIPPCKTVKTSVEKTIAKKPPAPQSPSVSDDRSPHLGTTPPPP